MQTKKRLSNCALLLFAAPLLATSVDQQAGFRQGQIEYGHARDDTKFTLPKVCMFITKAQSVIVRIRVKEVNLAVFTIQYNLNIF